MPKKPELPREMQKPGPNASEEEKQSYAAWAKQKGAEYYDGGWRWIEDTYLKWFGENRTSYAVKDTWNKTTTTGQKDVDGITGSVGNAVGNTVGSNGLAGFVGDGVDKKILRGNVWLRGLSKDGKWVFEFEVEFDNEEKEAWSLYPLNV